MAETDNQVEAVEGPRFFVFVENLAYSCGVDDLGDFFYNNNCAVSEVEVDHGRGRVFFEDQASKDLALTFNNVEFLGRSIRVSSEQIEKKFRDDRDRPRDRNIKRNDRDDRLRDMGIRRADEGDTWDRDKREGLDGGRGARGGDRGGRGREGSMRDRDRIRDRDRKEEFRSGYGVDETTDSATRREEVAPEEVWKRGNAMSAPERPPREFKDREERKPREPRAPRDHDGNGDKEWVKGERPERKPREPRSKNEVTGDIADGVGSLNIKSNGEVSPTAKSEWTAAESSPNNGQSQGDRGKKEGAKRGGEKKREGGTEKRSDGQKEKSSSSIVASSVVLEKKQAAGGKFAGLLSDSESDNDN